MTPITTQAIAALAASTGSEAVAALVDKKPDAGAIADAMIWKAARQMSDRSSEECGVNALDNWNLYSQDFIDEVKAIIKVLGIETQADRIADLEAKLAAAAKEANTNGNVIMAMAYALGRISDELGVEPEGADPILEAIAELREQLAQAEARTLKAVEAMREKCLVYVNHSRPAIILARIDSIDATAIIASVPA